jgi:hypothetical protein
MNNRWDFLTVADHLWKKPPFCVVEDKLILNYISKAINLTRGKLLQQQDRSDWQDSEYLQLNQYKDQGMFGQPVGVTKDDAVFHLIWTYSIKAVDG